LNIQNIINTQINKRKNNVNKAIETRDKTPKLKSDSKNINIKNKKSNHIKTI